MRSGYFWLKEGGGEEKTRGEWKSERGGGGLAVTGWLFTCLSVRDCSSVHLSACDGTNGSIGDVGRKDRKERMKGGREGGKGGKGRRDVGILQSDMLSYMMCI